MTSFPDGPAIPRRPAAYIRDADAATADAPGMIAQRETVISLAQDEGWPGPVVYAEAGQPGRQLTALTEAIAAGRHDGVFVTDAAQIGPGLAEIEAFDRLCRQHGVRVCLPWSRGLTDTTVLSGVICGLMHFTITDEHLRLLRHAYVTWFDAEFGAPAIDPKRPYGNSGVYADMAEILDGAESEWAVEGKSPPLDEEWRLLRLHVETGIALQIALVTGDFRTGRYVRDHTYDPRSWRRDET